MKRKSSFPRKRHQRGDTFHKSQRDQGASDKHSQRNRKRDWLEQEEAWSRYSEEW